MQLRFTGRILEWRGPAPYYFVRMPEEQASDVRAVAAVATYGWGVVPVEVRLGDTVFDTALFPKDGGYLLPLKAAVRRPHALSAGDDVDVQLTVRLG